MDKTELLNKMRIGRARLDAALAQLTDEQMVEPGLANGWSVKDLLAHFGFWERRIATLFDYLKRSSMPAPGVDDSDVDQLNARVYAENQARPLADIRREEQAAYKTLVALVENASDADLFDPHRFDWTEGDPFVGWIADNTYDHYREHLPALQAWVEQVRRQARASS